MGEAPARALGPYRLVRPLGHGGMAEVWEAEGPTRGRVALKTLPSHLLQEDAAAARRFWDEARLSLSLTHPNVVRTLDMGEDGGKVYLVMELLEGRTLAEVVRLGELPPIGWVTAVAAQLLEALAYVHARTLVHRDIKPSNLFVTGTGAAKVIDFGIALGDADRTRTQTGLVRGSLPYCSPEQVRGEVAGARSDLFSFGLVMHELLTGQRVFSQNSDAAIVGAVLFNPILPLRLLRADVPASLERVVTRLLEKDASLRPASAREALELLHAATEAGVEATFTQEQVAAWLGRAAQRAGAVGSPSTGTAVVRPPVPPPRETVATEALASWDESVSPPRRSRWIPLGAVGVAVAGVGVWLALGGAGRGVNAGATGETAAASKTSAAAPHATNVAPTRTANGPAPQATPGTTMRATPQLATNGATTSAAPLHATNGATTTAAPPLATSGATTSAAPLHATNGTAPRTASAPKTAGHVAALEVASASPEAAAPRPSPTRRAPSRVRASAKSKSAHDSHVAAVTGPPGFLTVATRSGWREVFVDGVDRGPTPLFRVQLAPGIHRLDARREGKVSLQQQVEVKPGEEARVGLE